MTTGGSKGGGEKAVGNNKTLSETSNDKNRNQEDGSNSSRKYIAPGLAIGTVILPWATLRFGELTQSINGFNTEMGLLYGLVAVALLGIAYKGDNKRIRQSQLIGGIALVSFSLLSLLTIQSASSEVATETEGSLWEETISMEIGLGLYLAVIAGGYVTYAGYQRFRAAPDDSIGSLSPFSTESYSGLVSKKAVLGANLFLGSIALFMGVLRFRVEPTDPHGYSHVVLGIAALYTAYSLFSSASMNSTNLEQSCFIGIVTSLMVGLGWMAELSEHLLNVTGFIFTMGLMVAFPVGTQVLTLRYISKETASESPVAEDFEQRNDAIHGE